MRELIKAVLQEAHVTPERLAKMLEKEYKGKIANFRVVTHVTPLRNSVCIHLASVENGDYDYAATSTLVQEIMDYYGLDHVYLKYDDNQKTFCFFISEDGQLNINSGLQPLQEQQEKKISKRWQMFFDRAFEIPILLKNGKTRKPHIILVSLIRSNNTKCINVFYPFSSPRQFEMCGDEKVKATEELESLGEAVGIDFYENIFISDGNIYHSMVSRFDPSDFLAITSHGLTRGDLELESLLREQEDFIEFVMDDPDEEKRKKLFQKHVGKHPIHIPVFQCHGDGFNDIIDLRLQFDGFHLVHGREMAVVKWLGGWVKYEDERHEPDKYDKDGIVREWYVREAEPYDLQDYPTLWV